MSPLPAISPRGRPLQPSQRAPRPERLARARRRIRDGLWSPATHAADHDGNRIVSMTHADGHSVVWRPRSTAAAALLDPEGRVVDTPAAWREAHAFAFHWAEP
ncbi:MAG: hypothetical protein OYH76_24610 [Defluviicoccus sp.]|nr:hypothetical protein [Defluviicoccus sp.]MDE0279091.1 hypothetical protein [Defluviicoccus sp.]